MRKYAKFYVAFGGFLSVLAQVVSDGVVSAEEVGFLVTAGIAAAGVFGVPNKLPVPPEAVEVIEQAKAQTDAAAAIFTEESSGLTLDGFQEKRPAPQGNVLSDAE